MLVVSWEFSGDCRLVFLCMVFLWGFDFLYYGRWVKKEVVLKVSILRDLSRSWKVFNNLFLEVLEYNCCYIMVSLDLRGKEFNFVFSLMRGVECM